MKEPLSVYLFYIFINLSIYKIKMEPPLLVLLWTPWPSGNAELYSPPITTTSPPRRSTTSSPPIWPAWLRTKGTRTSPRRTSPSSTSWWTGRVLSRMDSMLPNWRGSRIKSSGEDSPRLRSLRWKSLPREATKVDEWKVFNKSIVFLSREMFS